MNRDSTVSFEMFFEEKSVVIEKSETYTNFLISIHLLQSTLCRCYNRPSYGDNSSNAFE